MTIRQIRTLERNNATAELINALTDDNNEEIVSNSRYRYALTPDGEPYSLDVLEQLRVNNSNNADFTVKKYAGPRTYYNGDIGNLGSTNIIITFKNPVPNFYITVVNELSMFSEQGRNGYPLGYIKAYDSDDVIIKGVRPAFLGSGQEVIIDGIARTVSLVNSANNTDGIRTVDNKILYQFSIENTSKRIKKVILEAPAEGTQLIYYQSIDWNRPVPPPIVTPTRQTVVGSGTTGTSGVANATGTGFIGSSGQTNFVGDTTNLNALFSGFGGYGGGNHTHNIEPNPHVHNISPNPHIHQITPNPHRHGMRFLESGSYVDTTLENSCRVGPEVLINLIYNSLNTETAKEKSRVSEAAKKGNWITANKIGKPIWDYLENYYIRRVICYLQARIWYTEYETLTIVPTQLDVLPTGLIASYYGGNTNVIGALGQTINAPQTTAPRNSSSDIDVNNLEPGQRVLPFNEGERVQLGLPILRESTEFQEE